MDYHHIAELPAIMGDVAEDTIISRSLCKGSTNVNVTLFGFAPGQELTEHTSPRAAILYFLRGSARLTLGEDEQEAGPGTLVCLEPHLPHSIVADEETVMMLILTR